MNKLYCVVLAALGSCSSHLNYIGSTQSKTTQVDVYVAESAIKKPYSIIGKGILNNRTLDPSPERIQQKAIALAKQKGADAILMNDYFINVQSSHNNSTVGGRFPSDSNSKASITTSIHSVSFSPDRIVDVYFLKYER